MPLMQLKRLERFESPLSSHAARAFYCVYIHFVTDSIFLSYFLSYSNAV